MPVSVCEQTVSFGACIASGIVIGILYDIISVLRNGTFCGKISVFALDCFFWIISVIIFFAALQYTCGGEVHWYSFAGIFFGLAFYMIGISKFLLAPMTAAQKWLNRIFSKILKIIFTPFLRILRRIKRPVVNFVKNTQKMKQNFVKKVVEKIRRFSILLKKY